ncbi:hypothetical protein DM860_007766 [Cuscuta australis]|uniref:Uncharacterized protein n=1 Tax=Cuscuta australis TaxID=267555 RepID=A0A328DWK8_9ASTE|nr:hypothetical protein DM860_007766 [Cuscuta australis]
MSHHHFKSSPAGVHRSQPVLVPVALCFHGGTCSFSVSDFNTAIEGTDDLIFNTAIEGTDDLISISIQI